VILLAVVEVCKGGANVRTVLFLCVANSARSQMAEGLARTLAPRGEDYRFWSAGSEPGALHPLAVAALAEVGVDISHQRAKGLPWRYRVVPQDALHSDPQGAISAPSEQRPQLIPQGGENPNDVPHSSGARGGRRGCRGRCRSAAGAAGRSAGAPSDGGRPRVRTIPLPVEGQLGRRAPKPILDPARLRQRRRQARERRLRARDG